MLIVSCDIRGLWVMHLVTFICKRLSWLLGNRIDGHLLQALVPIYKYQLTFSWSYVLAWPYTHIHELCLARAHTRTHTPLATFSSSCPHCVLVLDKDAEFLLNENTCWVYSLKCVLNGSRSNSSEFLCHLYSSCASHLFSSSSTFI